MSKEARFFIRVLSDHLAQRETEPEYDINWNNIATIAQYHQVSGIVYFQCREFMPVSIKSVFEKQYQRAAYMHVQYKMANKQMESAFVKHGVDMFTVKGLEVAKYYPYPELRTMGDMDLIVHKNEREKADIILRELKYENDLHREDKEWIYHKQIITLELHNRMVYDETINENGIDVFFNNCWSFVKDDKLDDSFHFLFLLAHLRKHLMNTGVGFRQFMDIAVMAKNNTSLNWQWIEENLEKLKLYQFAQVTFSFIERWFGITARIKPEQLEEDFYDIATESILANGVFGFQNKDNDTNAAVNAARKHSSRKIGMFTNALRFVFPSYQEMNSRTAYAYLERKPYLLPVAWIHRYIRGMLKSDDMKKQTKQLFANKQEIDKRETYLRNWGL